MFASLEKYLQDKGSLTQGEVQKIEKAAVFRKMRKRQYLLEEGRHSDFIGFVVKGSFRLFRIDDKGEEHIMRFAIENWWISDFASFMTGAASNCFIETLESSELILFSKDKWHHLLETIPAFRQIVEKLTARNFDAQQERIYSNISEPAEVRYDNFLQQYPTLHNRIPLYMIASFLGLTRETLSRVRKNPGH